jgi:hypothetical protein
VLISSSTLNLKPCDAGKGDACDGTTKHSSIKAQHNIKRLMISPLYGSSSVS